jgi:PAS domain S-box-containing protein
VSEAPQTEWSGRAYRDVGKGWVASTPIISGHRLLGVLFNDSAISGSALNTGRQHLLALYCRLLGNLIVQKRAEQTMLANEERLSAIMRMVGDVLWSLDSQTLAPVFLSPHVEILFGRHLYEFFEDPRLWLDVILPDDMEEARQFYDRLRQGSPDSIVYRIRRPDGEQRWMSVSGRLLSKGEESGSLLEGIASDVTDQRIAEESARKDMGLHRAPIAERHEGFALMASGIAHDINNLVGGVLGNVSLAIDELQGKDGCESILESLEVVRRTGERAAEFSRQLLLYSGRARHARHPLELEEIVKEAVDSLRAQVGNDMELKTDFSGNIPILHGDAAQIRTILGSLLTNAREALAGCSRGMITVRTGVTLHNPLALQRTFLGAEIRAGSYAYMEVSDNGSGISEDVLPRIFDPYFTTRASHRGLGLALVQGIARSHGGAVSVSSYPGRDTRFTVVFPIETAPGGLIKNDRTAGSDDLPGGHP